MCLHKIRTGFINLVTEVASLGCLLWVPWNTHHSYCVLVFGVRSRTEVLGAVLWLQGMTCLAQTLPFCCKCGVVVPLSHRKGLWKVWFSPPRAVGPAFLFSYWNSPSWAVEIRGCVLHVQCLEAGRMECRHPVWLCLFKTAPAPLC